MLYRRAESSTVTSSMMPVGEVILLDQVLQSHVQFTMATKETLEKYILQGNGVHGGSIGGLNSIRQVEYYLPKIMLKVMGGITSP